MTAVDVTAAYHRNNAESAAANPTPASKAARRQYILDLIAAEGDWGATSDEIEQLTGWPHQSVSARFTELKASGAVVKAGTRPTRSGRSAAVYVVPEQPALFGGNP